MLPQLAGSRESSEIERLLVDSKWEWFRSRAKALITEDGKSMMHGWVGHEPVDLKSDAGYFVTIRLTDMHLGRSRSWGSDKSPLLQSVVSPPSSGVDVPMTIGPGSFEKLGGEGKWRWTDSTNLSLTGPLPFNRLAGELRVLCGLLHVADTGVLTTAANFLGTISGLVQVPQLSVASGVATKVAEGAEKLISAADPQGRVALDYGIAWNDLRRGYLVAVGADSGNYELDKFTVEESMLFYAGSAENVRSLDYFVLEVDIQEDIGERWTEFSTIHEPFQESIRLLEGMANDKGAEERSQAEVISAISATLRSPDLTVGERQRLTELLWSRWSDAKKAFVPPMTGRAADYSVSIGPTFEELIGQLLDTEPLQAQAAYAEFNERSS